MTARLIVLGGLPGVGKSTLARALATAVNAVWLRIDTIEQALRAGGAGVDVGEAGYQVAYRLAADNLRRGHTVIADSVNPLRITRDAWRAVASSLDLPVLDVEVVCSDPAEHRRRVETRRSDIPGLELPTWAQVQHRHYERRDDAYVVDTAGRPVEASVAELLAQLREPA